MAFGDQPHSKGHHIWNAQTNHSSVVELADGTLGEAAFRDWIEQEYQFRLDYARTFAVAAAKAPDEQRMADVLTVAHGTLEHNMELDREFTSNDGGSKTELDREGAQATAPRQQRLARLFERTVQRGVAFFDAALEPEMDGGRAW